MLPSVSIIMSVGDRPKHLRNTLHMWSLIDYPVFDFTLITNGVKNHEILSIAESFKQVLNMTIFQEPEMMNVNMIWNKYGKQSKGEYVVFAMMDEMISHKDILQRMVEVKDRRSSILVYFMDKNQTDQLDNLQWQDNFQIIPKPDTEHTSAQIFSHITGAYRKHWDWFGWIRNEDRGHLWLEQDVYIREVCLGKTAETPKDVYCLHQFHPSALPDGWGRPGFIYKTELQARLLEQAERDSA